jgi:hypothetical protein
VLGSVELLAELKLLCNKEGALATAAVADKEVKVLENALLT